MFAYQQFGIKPDALLLAKGLGGGIPIGACIAFGKFQDLMTAGLHGTTFGGNAPACAAALEVLNQVKELNLEKRALEIEQAVKELASDPRVDKVRGMGAMLGVILNKDIAQDVELKARENGLLVNAINTTILRLVPPLALTDEDLTQGIAILRTAIEDCAQ
jgi:acetylornithine aminotransferase